MRCKKCPFLTSSKEVMEQHMAKRHPPEKKATPKQNVSRKPKRKQTMKVDKSEKRKRNVPHELQTEISLNGTCRIEGCARECKDLKVHCRNYHSGRSHQCPFCIKEVTILNCFGSHLKRIHPYKIGILPGRSGEPLALDEIMSGNDLVELMRGYGQDVEGAVAYQFFAVSYDPANLCHRWVAFEVTQALVEASEKEEDPLSKFTSCPRVPGEQPISYAIHGVGCEHGHAAPKFLYRAYPAASKESCLFPNISAQRKGFNIGVSRQWELNEQRLAKHNDRVIVITGPTYNSNKDIGWTNAGCGFKHRIPEGFFRLVIIKNRGQPDVYQAFHFPNRGNNEMIFVERSSIEELQEKLGPSWILLPHLRKLSYTWENEDTGKYCKICKKSIPEETYYEHVDSHGLVCRINQCYAVFKNVEELKSHRLTQHSAGRFVCMYCHRRWNDKASLDVHIKEEHPNEFNFACPGCNEVFKLKETLATHYACIHAPVKRFYCPMDNCEQGFGTPGQLEIHCVSKHSQTKRFFCPKPDCIRNKIVHTGQRALMKHIKKKHPRMDTNDPEIRNQTTKWYLKELLLERGMTKDDLYNGSNGIKKRFEEERARQGLGQEPLRRNYKAVIHPQVKKYYCPIDNCRTGYQDRAKFVIHCVAAHSSCSRFYCPEQECIQNKKVFSSRNTLIEHRRKKHKTTTKNDQAIRQQTTQQYLQAVLLERGMTTDEFFSRSEELRRQKNEELLGQEQDD